MMKKFKQKTPITSMIANLKLNQCKSNDLSPTDSSTRASFLKQIETLLAKFVSSVEALAFDEKPNYAKLSETLTSCHLVMREVKRIGEICKGSETAQNLKKPKS